MANRPLFQINVPPPPQTSTSHMTNGSNGNDGSGANNKALIIPGLSADRALQFTPFTTSVLSVVDRIPVPEVTWAREHGRVAQSSERKQAQALLHQQQQQPPHVQANFTNELAAMLNRQEDLKIDFRLPPTPATNRSSVYKETSFADLGLSPLARSILQSTNFQFSYPTSTNESDSFPANDTAPVPKYLQNSQRQHPSSPLVAAPSTMPRPKNALPNSQMPYKVQKAGLVVQVPSLSQEQKQDYVSMPHSPKRRKTSHDATAPSHQSRTQKQQSDDDLHSFIDQLNDIFEGQDLIDAADGNLVHEKSLRYFDSISFDDELSFMLNARTLDLLREHMQKLLNLQRLHDVPTDVLQRLQALCDPVVQSGQSVSLRIDAEPDDTAMPLQVNLFRASVSMANALLVLYSMLGNPHNESLLNLDLLRYIATTLVNVFETCIIPVVEARPDTKDSVVFKQAVPLIDAIKKLLSSGKRLLELTTSACVEVKGGDSIVNVIEFLVAKLVFVQNAFSDKNSVLGLQTYEIFRKTAMASLSKIYARFPAERQAILDEVLSSLDKLPSTSRSARTFRTGNGQAIQLISALFMQIIQTTTLQVSRRGRSHRKTSKKVSAANLSDNENGASYRSSKHYSGEHHEDDSDDDDDDDDDDGDEESSPGHTVLLNRLHRKVQQLFFPASKSANDIVQYLVSRASKTTKTGDSPYRNILDLLIEDLINLLDDYEWPAAEILLNVLSAKMLSIAEKEKSASIKNMALESLGVMGSAISKLRTRLTTDINKLRLDEASSVAPLCKLKDLYLQTGTLSMIDLVGLQGPTAMVAHALTHDGAKRSLQHQSARSFVYAFYAQQLSQAASSGTNANLQDAVTYVVDSLENAQNASLNLDFDMPKPAVELAYLLCIVHFPFCRRHANIVKALSSSLTSDQAQVRSRSLKSVSAILEIDSSLLDRDQSIADDVFRCGSDDSAMVRDSALSFIARFMIPRGGALQEKGITRLLECAGDEKVGVQKRAIGHLKDIYTQERRPALRKSILQRLLIQLNDIEESIVSLVEQTLHEVLIAPVLALYAKDETSAITNVAIEELANMLMTTATEYNSPMLKHFFRAVLNPEKKGSVASAHLCERLVQALFEKVISTEKVQAPLVVLIALADADPTLVTALQLSKLQVYMVDLTAGTDPFMFRAAVGICRLVLPCLSETHKELLFDIQNKLMQSVSKMGRREELDVIMQCLATINGVLRNTDRLIKLSLSVLSSIRKPNQSPDALKKLLRIAGSIGKHIDLESHLAQFSAAFAAIKAKSVAGVFASFIVPFTFSEQKTDVRVIALESLGSTCQSSPAQFNNPNVRSAFFDTLSGRTADNDPDDGKLKAVVLKVFDELYAARAAAKDKDEKEAKEEGHQELKQMGGDSKSRDQDSAIQAITMDVVDATLRISMHEISDNALPSARTLASISHQGLIHPKQCLGAFVAFGTSQDPQLAAVGHKAQKLLHEQHESHCEREYMSAISEAFKYQDKIAQSPMGAFPTGQVGLRAKLGSCFDIITTSSGKYVKKFLSSLVSRLALDRFETEAASVDLEHVLFVRFVTQNIAFFEYKKLDELLHLVYQLELAYSKSGGETAQLIEAAQLKYPDLVVHEQVPADPLSGLDSIVVERRQPDPSLVVELKRLSPAAACLSLLIETRAHLLRQYGLERDVRLAMQNNKQAKDTNRVPAKVHGITGERFWNKSNAMVDALQADASATQLCVDFVAAMNVDDDLDAVDDLGMNMDADADPDMSHVSKSNGPLARKRKHSGVSGPSPTKRARGRPRKSQTRSQSVSSLEGDAEDDFP